MNDNDQEKYLIEMIEHLKQEYVKAAEPYVKRLAAIRSRRIGPLTLITDEPCRNVLKEKT